MSDTKLSIIGTLASKYGMEREAFERTLRKTIMPSGKEVSNEEFAAFCVVCSEYNLNPIVKEIYAFPAKGGGIMPIVSIDGWVSMINKNPQLDGIKFIDNIAEGALFSVTCQIYRKDRQFPVEVTEYMSECKRPTDPWRQYPARMLRHKALIQCARYAFGYSGIYDPDEGERIAAAIDVTPKTTKTEAVRAAITAVKPNIIEQTVDASVDNDGVSVGVNVGVNDEVAAGGPRRQSSIPPTQDELAMQIVKLVAMKKPEDALALLQEITDPKLVRDMHFMVTGEHLDN